MGVIGGVDEGDGSVAAGGGEGYEAYQEWLESFLPSRQQHERSHQLCALR